jgi:Raf kinase inhibitor-like YbhB/YbcL family protein
MFRTEGIPMQLKSSAFRAGGAIPARYTCEGEDISPELSWTDIPARTKSLALILHDPDAPREGGFTHWVVYDIDPSLRQIDENTPKQEKFAGIGIQGSNDSGKIGYMGPCPPSGQHRYVARLFALDTELNLRPGASHHEVESAMQGHILEKAALMGTYARKVAA